MQQAHRPHRSHPIRLAALLTLLLATFASLLVASPRAFAAGFVPGNLVVLRLGDGSAALSGAATAVFLDEYSAAGALAQTLALPTAASGANASLTNSGTAGSEGALARSADGRYLTLVGYDAAPGTAGIAVTASASVNRVVARVDATGAVDTSTRVSDAYNANNIRSAVTNDGTGFWTTGPATPGGLRYVAFGSTGASTGINGLNSRVVNIFADQLYVTSASGANIGVNQVGTGLPTSGAPAATLLPGLPNSGSPYAYLLLDRDPAVAGVDSLYIADQTATGTIGLAKYSFDGTTWTARGNLAGVLTGLTGVVSGNSVTLYATLGTAAGNTLVSFTDSAAYNATITAGSFTTLATAAANTAFRGVALAPVSGVAPPTAPSITTPPGDQTITTGTTASLSVTASGSAPLSYQWYQGASGDTSTSVGTDSPNFTTPALAAATSYWVRVSNSVSSADSAAATVTVTAACVATDTPIHDVQGAGATAAITGTVTVQGVVVGDYEGASPTLRGFYLQDQTPDADPATSEGIFVFNNSANSVSLGQVVQVTGTAAEYQDQTQITATTTESCGTTANVTPVDVSLPVPAPVGGVPYLERYEGMLVRFPQTLYVSEHFQLGRFGQVVVSSGARLPQPTNIVAPGAAAQAQQTANNLNRIIVDDALNSQNPDPILFGRGGNPLSASNTLRGGDSASNMVGVLTYTWAGNSASGNAYRLRPLNALGGGAPNFQPVNVRPVGPPTVGGRLKVASFNVLNYFLSLDTGSLTACGPTGAKQQCRGAQSATELDRQQQKLNQALLKLDADVVGLIELENTQNAQGQDVNPLADIVARLNSALGSAVYGYLDTGIVGTDTIRVGMIYKQATVTPVGAPLVDTNPIHNRPPVGQLFAETGSGERFSVIVNHFKSKGCGSGETGGNADLGDGQSCWNQTRVQQAQALTAFINGTVVPTTGDPDVLLIGDFNAYAKEDPITTLASAGFTNLVARFGGADAYSYVFDGQWGYLDQGLASPSLLAQVTGAGDDHINADEPSVLDYNTDFKSVAQVASLFNADEFRTSDHDPVVIGLNLHPLAQASADAYSTEVSTTLTVNAAQGLLANDTGAALAIISHSEPGHGTLALAADGAFIYTPQAGHIGADTFTYTVNNATAARAVQIYRTNLPSLGNFGGVNLSAGGYGSAIAPVPGSSDEYYGLTDRGPNVDGPNGSKIEAIPSFVPAIGKFKLVDGQATLEQKIDLQAADGTPYNGQASTLANTGETIYDLNGNVLPASPYGYDSEGLVALADGTFWVSDEYGPFITHFDASGKQTAQLSPFNGTLPAELAKRIPNRGMEGLTVTPDGSTLVGIMQSALQQSDLTGYDGKKLTPIRIVTYKLANGETHEYLYLLDNPLTMKTAVSEITALSNTTFLVDERDGNFLPGAYKKLWKIDLSGATDVGPSSTVAGATYDAASGGLLIGGKSLELLVKGQDTVASTATLASNGIVPTSKSPYLDLGALLTGLDAQGHLFAHDKIEGVAVANGGTRLVISNDSDFGIDGVTNSAAPFLLHAKVNPAGQQDEGEFLVIDLASVTATVTITTQDTVAPETQIDTKPDTSSDSRSASFTFHGADSGAGVASFECRLDGGAWSACTSGVSYTGLSEGSHTFQVRAIDNVGNADATPTSITWTITATAPTKRFVYLPFVGKP